MKKPSIGIKVFGWIEILTFLTTIITLVRIDYYPMILLFSPTPIAILGIFTIKLKPLARRLNLFLSPFIVFTYSFGFMMISEAVLSIANSNFKLNQWHFCILFVVILLIHILFFTRPQIKEQFSIN